MKTLKIDLQDFAMALAWNSFTHDSAHFLDTETGEVHFIGPGMDEDLIPPDFEDNPRSVRIDALESSEAFSIMEDFVEALGDTKMARRLAAALERPKPFRRFKDALFDDPALREAWFAFELEAHRQIGTRWCAGRGIEAEWVGLGA
jgi:hypothetical protein